jgi:hypothetical protein
VRSAKVISTRGEAGLLALAHQNPMSWLQKRRKLPRRILFSPNLMLCRRKLVFRPQRPNPCLPARRAEIFFFWDTKSSNLQGKIGSRVRSGQCSATGKGHHWPGLDEVDEQLSEQIDYQAVASTNIAGSLPRLHFSEKK